MTRVLAIDPGIGHTGVVLFDEYGISLVKTISFREPVNGDCRAVAQRCRDIRDALAPLLAEWEHDVTVMEGWTFMGKRSNASSIWETPWASGYLQCLIEEADGRNITLQTSPESLRGTGNKAERKIWIKRIPGWNKLTNEHTISAAIHGWRYIEESSRPRLFD